MTDVRQERDPERTLLRSPIDIMTLADVELILRCVEVSIVRMKGEVCVHSGLVRQLLEDEVAKLSALRTRLEALVKSKEEGV